MSPLQKYTVTDKNVMPWTYIIVVSPEKSEKES